MPQPAPNLPYSPQEQESLLNSLLTRLRGKVVTAVAGVFDRLNVSGDINARNLTTTGAVTPRLVKTNFKGRAHASAGGQTLISGHTTVSFPINDYGLGGSTFVAPVTGIYAITAQVGFTTGNTTNLAQINIYVGAVQTSFSNMYQAWAGGQTFTIAIDDELALNAGDNVVIDFFQNSGASWNTVGSGYCRFAVHYLSS